MSDYKIGVIGKGFVGSAVSFGFSANVGVDYEIRIFDVDPQKSSHSLEETVNGSDFVFISVPTPANSSGEIDLSILDKCLAQINGCIVDKNTIFLIRSTVVPGSSRYFQQRYPDLKIVFNPEFLTERSANFDFISQTRYVLGGDAKDTGKAYCFGIPAELIFL